MRAHRRYAAFTLASLMLAGCASYRPAPLASRHPAHPDSPAGAEPALSRTLAYTPADIPRVRAVPTVTGTPHEAHGSRPADPGAAPAVVGEGQVVATVPGAGQLVVDHEEIKGFMEAMTMGYRTDPPSLLDGLRPGDRIRFTIDVQRRAITAVEKVK